MKEIDSITLEVIWSRLIAIVDEMAINLKRMSFSTIVREANDYACVLFDQKGNSVASNSIAIPSFIGTLPRTIRRVLEKYPPESLREGDVVATNDPWIGSGHLPDISVVAPIFRQGALIGFSGSVAHASDVGGRLWSADAKELFEEGIRIPIMKLRRSGRPNQDLMELFLANVRVPKQVKGDINAQILAGEVMSKRINELLTEYGLEDIAGISEEIIRRTERAMRNEIAAIPDGTCQHTVHADGFESPIRISCSLTIDGSDIRVDYSGTSPQSQRGINVVPNYTFSFSMYAIKCVFLPETPINEGCFRPCTVSAPEGTILNPTFPAPVGARHVIGHFTPYAILGALAEVVPERVIAEGGTSGYPYFGGANQNGHKFTQFLPMAGGYGAHHHRDGENCLYFPSNASNVPVEIVEAMSPLQILKKELVTDSGGPGKFRGGCGQEFIVRAIDGIMPLTMSMITERTRFPAGGVLGGKPGLARKAVLDEDVTPHPKTQIAFPAGSRLATIVPGGGGYGSPLERDPQRVARDVKLELVSIGKAREDYGVVLDTETGEVLAEETAVLRREMQDG